MKKDRTITQICKQCSEPYSPTRKGAQKFCSASCRSRYWFLKNEKVTKKTSVEESKEKSTESPGSKKRKKTEIEKISASGVGNAALGTLAVNAGTALVKKLFVSTENEPASKGDVQKIIDLINTRYFLIHNMERRYDGCLPYFDMATSHLVYLRDPNYTNTANFTP